jgi:hypothetical protein
MAVYSCCVERGRFGCRLGIRRAHCFNAAAGEIFNPVLLVLE